MPHGYAAYAVGKWHLTPEDEEHLGARRDRWPLGRGLRALLRLLRRRDAPVRARPRPRQPPRRAAAARRGRLPPDRGPRRPRDRVRGRPAPRRRRRSRSSSTSRTGACHSPHQAPREWIERYRGRFDAGWDVWREAAPRPPDRGRAAARPTPSCRRARTGCRRGTTCPPTSGACTPATWRPSPAFLSHTDHQVGRLLDLPRGDRRARRHDRRRDVRQRCHRRRAGRSGRSTTPASWNVLPRPVEEAADRLDEIGGPRIHNNYPWGWTVAGNTPFRRWKRETHEGGVADPLIVHWPAGIDGSRRGAPPVRPRHRHRCRPLLDADRHRPAEPRSTASPSDRSTA